MKKIFLVMIISVLALSFISALNLEVKDTSNNEAMILGLSQPAMFNLSITNHADGDNLMFYNFFGSDTLPKGTVPIRAYETKNVEVGVYPRSDMKQQGRILFDLYIKGEGGKQMTVPLMVNVVTLNDAFEVGAEEFKPDSNNISVYIRNIINFDFNDVKVDFKSPFFSFEKTVSFKPYEKQVFEINLNKDDFRDLMAGFYTVNANVNVGNLKADVQGTLKFVEKDIVTENAYSFGVVVYTQKIVKTNDGNVLSPTETVVKKNVLSRLFTTFSPEPDIVDRKGLAVYYTWEKELKPGDKLNISVTTNWLLPLLAVLLVIAVIILVKQFSRTNLVLKKRVSFVRAKGGEFALKVSVIVTAKKFVEKVNVIDRLPPITKLHEKFGGELPKKVDLRSRRIEWHFDRLQEGESRMISYIIYSKVGVLGRFALPTTTAVYEKDGEVHEAESNQAFFVAEQARQPED